MGRLIYRSLALGLSRSRSCSFILCLSHSVISYRCAHGLMPSGSLDIVILSSRALMLSCCRTLILAYDHDIMLAWHHAPMISCSHNRGVIMILHFPSPTPSCPHAPSLLQSLTCKETLPHCLASRSLIVQVFAQALIHRKYRWIVASRRPKGFPGRGGQGPSLVIIVRKRRMIVNLGRQKSIMYRGWRFRPLQNSNSGTV